MQSFADQKKLPFVGVNEDQQAEIDLAVLETQLDELLGICERLTEENQSLRTAQNSLVTERATLVSKNEQARSRVEAMINRLKAMEGGQ